MLQSGRRILLRHHVHRRLLLQGQLAPSSRTNGNAGNTEIVEWSDMMVSTQGPKAGAILME